MSDQSRDASERDDRYIRSLEEQVQYLRAQLEQEQEARTEERRRQDMLIVQLSQTNEAQARTIRKLEPPRPPSPQPDQTGGVGPGSDPSPGLLQQAGTTVMTTLVSQSALAAFSACSLLKGNIRLVIILGVGQVLLLAGTLLYVRAQSRFAEPARVEIPEEVTSPLGQARTSERMSPPPPAAPPVEEQALAPFPYAYGYAYRIVLWSIITIAVVFLLTIAFALVAYNISPPWVGR